MANTQPKIAVKELTIVSKTKNSVTIRWNKATDLETPQSKLLYTVTWCVAPYVWDNNVRKIGERKYDNSSYTITGLKPLTTYEIIVYVRDEGGYENAYARTKVTTLPDVAPNTAPTIPNKNVYLTKAYANSIEISWQKATDKETAQKDLRYLVLWSPGPSYSSDNRKQSPYLTDTTSYKITGLYPRTPYKIWVYVFDGKLFSGYAPITVTTNASIGSTFNTHSTGTNNNTSTTNTNNDAERRRQINAGLSGIEYSPKALVNNNLYNDDKENYPDAFESLPDRDFAYVLTKKETNIDGSTIYVRGIGFENIYPGAILFVDTELTNGSPNPLPLIPRSKISLYGDFLAGGNPVQNDVEPSNQGVRTATNNIMEILLKDSRYKAPGRQAPKTKIYTSQKSLMMDFGVDAKFAGISLSVKAKTTKDEQTFVQATTLEQDYFTVRLKDNWRIDPSSLFDKSVTWDQLRNVLRGRAIAIVTSVTYGRTFSYMKEYSAKKFTFDSSQKVSAYGQSANGSQSLAESSEYTNDSIFNLGGTALTISALRGKKTQAELEKAMADNMEFGRSNQGVVTKYTLQLITGINPGKAIIPSYTGKQYEIGYKRCPRTLAAYINVSDVSIGAGKVKVQIDPQCFSVNSDGSMNTFVPKSDDAWYYTFDHSRNREYGDLRPGEYFRDPLLRIRSKRPGGSYTADDSLRLNHGEIETGSVNIVLKGNVFSAVKIKRVEPK